MLNREAVTSRDNSVINHSDNNDRSEGRTPTNLRSRYRHKLGSEQQQQQQLEVSFPTYDNDHDNFDKATLPRNMSMSRLVRCMTWKGRNSRILSIPIQNVVKRMLFLFLVLMLGLFLELRCIPRWRGTVNTVKIDGIDGDTAHQAGTIASIHHEENYEEPKSISENLRARATIPDKSIPTHVENQTKKARGGRTPDLQPKKNETERAPSQSLPPSRRRHTVVVQLDSFIYLLRGGQRDLCRKILDATGAKQIGEPLNRRGNSENLRGGRQSKDYNDTSLILLNMTLDCHDPMSGSDNFGIGLFMKGFYSLRIAAAMGQADLSFHCSRAPDYVNDIIAHFQGYYPAPTIIDPWPQDVASRVCGMQMLPSLYIMAREIQRELRKLAVTVVGSRGHDISNLFPTGSSPVNPVLPDAEIDDVAIHFRCGDIFSTSLPDFGIINFHEYLKFISPHVRSIGIVTQPFEPDRNRKVDADRTEDCKRVVLSLVDFLHAAYPSSKVCIRNDKNETLPLAFARLTMANQSFVSLSSFGIFPVVSTFGNGYFQRGNAMVNPFAEPMQRYLDNIHVMDAAVLSSADCASKPVEDIIQWLVKAQPQ
ncbi:hypothetical protein MHU86_11071 [Fragilaria crotonensis]|nr:hypothetical protein MHU86_11071 [Fragilaria crotonensis]